VNLKLLLTFTILCSVFLAGSTCSNRTQVPAQGKVDIAPAFDKPAINIAISANPVIANEDPIIIEFEISNAGKKKTAVLSWGTPLEGRFSRPIFQITQNKRPVRYNGPMIKRGNPEPSDFIELIPGESFNASIDLREAYTFAESGTYIVMLDLPVLTLRTGTKSSLYFPPDIAPIKIRIQPQENTD
jgi:hypothetical protein